LVALLRQPPLAIQKRWLNNGINLTKPFVAPFAQEEDEDKSKLRQGKSRANPGTDWLSHCKMRSGAGSDLQVMPAVRAIKNNQTGVDREQQKTIACGPYIDYIQIAV